MKCKTIYDAIAIPIFLCRQIEKTPGFLLIKFQKQTFYTNSIYSFLKNQIILVLSFFLLNFTLHSKESSKDITVLFQLCDKDQVQKIEEIENLKDKINIVNKKGMTLLSYCIEKKAEKSSLSLLKNNINYKWEDINNYNYATFAVRAGLKTVLIKILNENPALLFSKDRFKLTLLDHAIIKKRKEIIKLFIENYPEFFNKSKTSFTSIQKAVETGSIEILESILSSKPNVKENEEAILLQKSAEYSMNTIGFLLSLGFNVNSKDEKGNTVIHKIALLNNSELIEYLKIFPFQMSRNLEGQLPIHIAARYGKTKVFKKLLEWGTGVNEVDMLGNTPLHLSAEFGDSEMVYYCITSSQNLNLKNKKGESPLAIAKLSGNDANYYLLMLAGAVE